MITQNYKNNNYLNFIHDFYSNTNYLNNHTIDFSVNNYIDLCINIAKTIKNTAKQLFINKIEMIDNKFRNNPERLNNYYIKDSRFRTIITPFGEVTFKRTIYQCKHSNKCYTHVDRLLGLPKYDRYDPAVKSMIIKLYSDQNSMIKVGKIIGDRIYSNYSIDETRNYHIISRQTIHNVVSQMKVYIPTIKRIKHTPNTLYIMADEHFVALQKSKSNCAMIKAGVIFDGIRNTQKHHQRNEYLNKHYHFSLDDNFWEDIYQIIIERYDIDKIKNIYIMGDGANWIKKGIEVFKRNKAVFGIDRFHMKQAIIKLTTDPLEIIILLSYLDNLDKESFMILAKSIIQKESSIKDKTKKSLLRYLSNNWEAYRVMEEEIVIGCGMEGQISHTLASIFSSVPKAYSEDNLLIYTKTRALMLNGYDLRKVFIKASESKHTIVYENEKVLNWSIFESRESETNSTLPRYIRGFIASNKK